MDSKNYPNPPYPTSPPYMANAYPHPHQAPPAYEQSAPVIAQAPVFTTVYQSRPAVGPDPSALVCPSCRQRVVSRLEYETTTKTHIMAGLLCAFICWPCAWVPYVMDSCKNANHYCPNCGAFIGTYKS